MKKALYLYLFLLACCVSTSLTAQTISATVDRNKIFIGEKLILTIKVEDAKPQNIIEQWISLPDTINHFEVIDRGKIDTITVDGIVNYQQIIHLTSFDSGRWEIPVLDVKLGGMQDELSASSIVVDVLPVDVSQLKDYNDVKEIIEVDPDNSKLLLIILIIAALLIIAVIIWLILRRKKSPITKLQPIDNRKPLEWALSEIEKLRLENLPAKGLAKQFYQGLTDISRQYFYRQLGHSAIHQTTEEWMFSLQELPIDANIKTRFFQFIRLADIVKFAKYVPPVEEYDNSINDATNMLTTVNAWVQYSAKPATAKQ